MVAVISSIKDNECFKWCFVKYLHPADHKAARIRKVDKELDFKDIKFSVKFCYFHKFEKKTFIIYQIITK